MPDFDSAARPYARAVFELASEEGKLQQWQDSLLVAAAVAVDDNMQAVFDQPSMLAEQKAELFLSVMASAGNTPDAHFTNLVKLLAEKGRLGALPTIALTYEELKQQAEGQVEVQVVSAQPLTDEQRQKIADSLTKKLGKEVSISAEVDESLIAGAIISAGDMVIDGSAKGRMEKLAVALNK